MAARQSQIAFWLVFALLAASAVGMSAGVRAAGVYLRKLEVPPPRALSRIHPESASFVRFGNDRLESAEVVETLGTENYVTRTMVERDVDRPRSFDLHAAYYTGMIDTVPHVPERCFVGGGLQIAEDAEVVPLELDVGPLSAFRLEGSDPLIPGHTPEDLRPIERADGSREVFWYRTSNRHASIKGAYVRVPFDPSRLKLRVSAFLAQGERPIYSGYFFIANGGVTSSANDVRQLAFKRQDKYAYYVKVQFSSTSVSSHEELAELASRYLQENLGEILLSTPDWIELQMRERGELEVADAG